MVGGVIAVFVLDGGWAISVFGLESTLDGGWGYSTICSRVHFGWWLGL
jgi:hypothetical protein